MKTTTEQIIDALKTAKIAILFHSDLIQTAFHATDLGEDEYSLVCTHLMSNEKLLEFFYDAVCYALENRESDPIKDKRLLDGINEMLLKRLRKQ